MTTEAEKRIELASMALFPPETVRDDRSSVDHSADGNLEAVIIDLEMRGADKVCIGTLNSILIRLTAAREALTR